MGDFFSGVTNSKGPCHNETHWIIGGKKNYISRRGTSWERKKVSGNEKRAREGGGT